MKITTLDEISPAWTSEERLFAITKIAEEMTKNKKAPLFFNPIQVIDWGERLLSIASWPPYKLEANRKAILYGNT